MIFAEDVRAVLWVCLIAKTNVWMCIPQFIMLTKDGFPHLHCHVHSAIPGPLRLQQKIIPVRCSVKLALHHVTFPTHHHHPNVSTFLPVNEITFIIGSFLSGIPTVFQRSAPFRDVQPSSGTRYL
ncbi:uncharacterized protein LACBIDRAFT_310662 [Laccaria bicolor S238N-H82]|uniref:Predicted protein n=1 Tax=Laccaria bicolor (strain S238N-H82 / ATCC MYA-4686) TaxID=486041 RepID=B0DUU2_LACBS|nr:uncharacterized protein LACBIDRAFT_310662 [Laccaria bicolor S238N-H82]EDR01670.1 predicted protein [Laccaria bicolor S238N-H82]|eukprot:XP_001887746.1 predicted protein [Laccaria bicolor S238N-H82]